MPLPHLADYTERLNAIFAKHDTRGDMHASKAASTCAPCSASSSKDVERSRAIAGPSRWCANTGSHSGEHSDGIVRSGIHRVMFGSRIVATGE